MIQVLFKETFQNVDCRHCPSAKQPQHSYISSVCYDERCMQVKPLVIQKITHPSLILPFPEGATLPHSFQGTTLAHPFPLFHM